MSTAAADRTSDALDSAPEAVREVERRRFGPPSAQWWQTALFGVAILLAWQLLSGPLLNEQYFSSPVEIVDRFREMVSSGDLGHHVTTSLKEFITGYVIGVVGGIVVGVGFALLPRVSAVIQPYMFAFYSVPNIALAPLFVILFGIGIGSKVALVVLGTFFFVFLTTYHGATAIDRELISVARIMGASTGRIIRRVLIPSALPAIFLGIRGAVPHALTGVVVGEFIASSEGVGWMVVNAANGFDTAGLFVGVLVLAAASLLLTWLAGRVERMVVKWQPSTER
jgi:NitT/TauT family transport system permease protein